MVFSPKKPEKRFSRANRLKKFRNHFLKQKSGFFGKCVYKCRGTLGL